MTTVRPQSPLPAFPAASEIAIPQPRRTSRERASRSQLLAAASLGAAVATADLTGCPADAATAYAAWRRLRRRVDREARQLLRVAFDTGYGRAVHASGLLDQPGGVAA